MRRAGVWSLGMILLLTAVACTPAGTYSRSQKLSPEQTVEQYVEALNAGDYRTAAGLLSSRHAGELPSDTQGNIRSVRLIQVGSMKSPAIRPEDIANRKRLPGVHDACVVWVEFDIEFTREQSMTNGRHSWNYILIKESPEGPWLIDDWGH